MPEPEFQTQDPAYVLAELNGRIRMLEDKYHVLTERLLVVNQNMIMEYKKLMKEMKEMSQDAKKTRMSTASTQDVVQDIVKEMGVFAKKDQVKLLEKYMDLLDILKFVTDDQLEKRLEKFKLEDK